MDKIDGKLVDLEEIHTHENEIFDEFHFVSADDRFDDRRFVELNSQSIVDVDRNNPTEYRSILLSYKYHSNTKTMFD